MLREKIRSRSFALVVILPAIAAAQTPVPAAFGVVERSDGAKSEPAQPVAAAVDITDAISREVSVYMPPRPPTVTDAISREVSVLAYEGPHPAFTDAVSREMSVYTTSPPVQVTDAISRETSVFSVIPITLGTPYDGVLAPGNYLFFRLNTPADLTLRIDLDHDSTTAWTELYASFGRVPDTFNAEFSSESPGQPDQELVVPNTQDGTYYILARCTTDSNATASKNFRLIAQASLFGLDWIKPTTVGAGVATIEFRGARFSPTTTFAVVDPENGEVISPVATTLIDPAHALVTFDLTARTIKPYHVRVSEPGGPSAQLALGLQLDPPTGQDHIELTHNFPSALRGGRAFEGIVSIKNMGNVDIDVVMLTGLVPNDPHIELWPTELADGATPQDFGPNKGFTILTCSPLAPGEVGAIEVSVRADTTFPAHGRLPFFFVARPYTWSAFQAGPLFELSEVVRLAVLDDASQPGDVRAIAEQPDVWWALIRDNVDQHQLCPSTTSVASFGDIIKTTLICVAVCVPIHFIPVVGPVAGLTCHFVCHDLLDPEPACGSPLSCTAPCATDAAGSGGCTDVGQSGDPNQKDGLVGYANQRFLRSSNPLDYKVSFENVAQATAPAAEIRIIDQLDSTLDAGSFRLTRIQFGENRIELPAGRSSINTVVDPGFANGLLVEVTGGIDVASRKASWTLRALDPETRQLPANPILGFLPPNINPPEGEGFVEFTIKPNTSTPTGTVVTNMASIVFDYNDPIQTNEVFHTIDAAAPVSAVQTLPAQRSTPFVVRWSAQDDTGGSGLAAVDVFVKTDAGLFERWINSIGDWAYFDGEVGKTYALYAIGRDNVGNVEDAPATPDATTTVTAVRHPGDVDYDGDADLTDHSLFAQCFGAPPNATTGGPDRDVASVCAESDQNVDDRVDLLDFAELQNGFTGTRQP